jgi:eukaryotic-like serine/threonine-protein kinase
MPLALRPGASLKHYRIVELLGKGGMGEVYAAEDTRLGRMVAIKSLPHGLAGDAERLRRFTQEAKAASALNHPSILTIHDVDEVDGRSFLVTEFIEGQTLRERLRHGALPLGEAIDIAGQVASALSAAHVAAIVHRDVKPENIMLREDGHAKLVDFGLAKIEQDAAAANTEETVTAVGARTTPGIIMGTTAYMSPEQARGLPVDARSDIFSLGVVLYEMTAGRPPFHGETPSDVIAAILHFEPPPIADLPPDLEHTLRKALEKDRDERHQTARDFAADLKRLRRRLAPAAGTPPASTGQGAGAWTTTPKSGGAAARAAAPRASTTAPHAEAASGTRTATSTRGRLVFAGIAGLVVIGVAVLGWRGDLARWFGGETSGSRAADISNFEGMRIERVSGLGQVGVPVISPDGKLLAYVRTEGPENAIWLRQMATGSVVKVVGPTQNSIYNVQFTPDNNFLYYSDNTATRPIRYALKAVPAFGGPEREIAEGRFSRVSFSPDGRRFVVRRGLPVGWELVVMTTDGSAPVSVIATSPTASQAFVSPSWSPSGDELAWINIETDPRGIQMTLQFMKPDSTGARTLTPSGNPRPFLDQIAWTASDDALLATGGGSSRQILLIRTSDGHVERVTNDVHDYSALSFSPGSGAIATVQTMQLGSIWIGPADRPEEAREVPSRLGELDGYDGLSWLNDRELVFNRTVSNLSTLWTMQAEGGGARQLAQGSLAIATNPRADRSGRTVIFNGIREAGNLPQVYRLTLPDGRVTQVTRENGARAGSSSDGRTVYFRPYDIKTAPGKILRMAADGAPAARVFEAPILIDYSLSPDGTQIAAIANASVGAPRTISLVPAEGGAARSIFTSTAALRQVRWYPGGDALLLAINENRQENLFRLELAGGPPRQLTHFTRGTILNPEISPDGKRIAYHRGTTEPDLVLLKPQKD